VTIKDRAGETVVRDDEACKKFDEAKIRSLKPAFRPKDGTITAGNASPISDGAAALVLMSRAAAVRLNKPILAVLRGYADAEQEPALFGLTPALAVPLALQRAHLTQEQVDFFELNEAFAVVALANLKLMHLDPAKVNVHGGAIALGHPLGLRRAR